MLGWITYQQNRGVKPSLPIEVFVNEIGPLPKEVS
jgi:hypothetical protein